jgi:heme iron utilization protein
MLSRLELLVELLHTARDAALATQSVSLPGYPFATAIPFVADQRQRPVFLISALAEHSRNLAADARASLMLATALGDGETARITVVGDVAPIDADPALVARYLRYHPPAERFLQLGDFRFHRLEPTRVLTVGGFARAAWLDGEQIAAAPALDPEQEAVLLADVVPPPGMRLLGIDPWGIDLAAPAPIRLRFDDGPLPVERLAAEVAQRLARHVAAGS